MKKYKKKAECPSLLQVGIDKANLVSFDKDVLFSKGYLMLSADDYIDNLLTGEFTKNDNQEILIRESLLDYEEAAKLALKHIENEVRDFPKFYSYLFDEPEDYDKYDEETQQRICFHYHTGFGENYIHSAFTSLASIEETLDKYDDVLFWKDNLRSLVKDCQNHIKPRNFLELLGKFFNNYFLAKKENYAIKFGIDENDKIHFNNISFVDALSGVDAKRLRICPICEEVFWLNRIEAKTCSKRRCSNNFHQRKLRVKEYEKRLGEELKNLEKFQSNLCPENSLIAEQSEKVNKLQEKIHLEKKKNGTL